MLEYVSAQIAHKYFKCMDLIQDWDMDKGERQGYSKLPETVFL